MADILVEGSTVIRDTLLTIPEISLVLDPVTGQHKIFWEDADDPTDFPYIYTSYGLGDWDQRSLLAGEASEVTWKVVGVTNDKAEALALSAIISKLVDPKEYEVGNVVLTVNDPLVACNGRPRAEGRIFDRWPVQGHTFYEVGVFLRLYLAHKEA